MRGFYRYGTIDREVFKALDVDWCALMNGTDVHPAIKVVVNVIKESVPEIVHDCPYQKVVQFN
jgi:hypothetical protein